MSDIDKLLGRLNSYDGDNIWQDVIFAVCDQEKTDEIDPSYSSDRFALGDGTVIRWDGERREWRRT